MVGNRYSINPETLEEIKQEIEVLWPKKCFIPMPDIHGGCRCVYGYLLIHRAHNETYEYEIAIVNNKINQIRLFHQSTGLLFKEWHIDDYCKKCLNRKSDISHKWCRSCINNMIDLIEKQDRASIIRRKTGRRILAI